MPWSTQIDPNAGEDFIGSVWVRREPEDESPWNRVRIVGVHDNGPDHGHELCLQTEAFSGEPVVTASADSLADSYRRLRDESDDDPVAALSARVRALEARGA